MNTKTMRLPPRRVLTPGKRKDGDISSVTEKLPNIAVGKLPPPVISTSRKFSVAAAPVGSNQLILAGYLSHEFLTNGTLFGKHWNPTRAQAGQLPAQSVEPRKINTGHIIELADQNKPKRTRYTEVANLLRADGAHLPDIVNPAQLARFLKL